MSSRVTTKSPFLRGLGWNGKRAPGESNIRSGELVKSIPSMQDFMQQTVTDIGREARGMEFLASSRRTTVAGCISH
jgi:hypothetical protein